MLDRFIRETWWPGILVWVILYCTDYALTIAGARAYRDAAKEHIVYEGSYELTPYYQADVDSLRWLSSRFLVALLYGVVMLLVLWGVTHLRGVPPMLGVVYEVGLGALVVSELAVHVRHFRNLAMFKTAFGPEGARGQLIYPRSIMLRGSAYEFLSFAAMFMVLWLLTGSWLLFGGTVRCLSIAQHHRLEARKP